ncbi:MAG: radical SAM protein, partial [Lachnospiraceae bacterium]|nr:radical SAM protein [Lachnospiraceae bacterium]
MDNLHFPLLALARLRMGTDGKGVTTLAAGAGCPLSCRYCINKRLLKEAPREDVTAEELIEKIRIDDLYFRATGGGVTFGGGESLLHAAFIGRFKELCPPEWRIAAE